MHTCPRRRETGMDNPDDPRRAAGQDLDRYMPGHGIVGQSRGCSYCGSMSPDDFMQAVRDGAEIGPTDKNSKAYVTTLMVKDRMTANNPVGPLYSGFFTEILKKP